MHTLSLPGVNPHSFLGNGQPQPICFILRHLKFPPPKQKSDLSGLYAFYEDYLKIYVAQPASNSVSILSGSIEKKSQCYSSAVEP